MKNMLILAFRAAALRRGAYRQVADVPDEILKSVGIVVMTAILFGLGLVGVVREGAADLDVLRLADRLISLWLVSVTALLGWILWSVSSHLLGAKFLGGAAAFRELMRVLGICYGPMALAVLLPMPGIGPLAYFTGLVWVLVAGIAGVHEAQRSDWWAAVLSTVTGWAIFVVAMPVVILSFAGLWVAGGS